MDFWEAISLGIVQGITEFLPVSSSGHLVLAEHILGIKKQEIFFDVVLHIGTLMAVLIFFRKELIAIFHETLLLLKERNISLWLDSTVGRVFIGTLPVVFIGGLFHDAIETMFGSPLIVGVNFLITAIFLFSTKYSPLFFKDSSLTWKKALFIGLFQCIALVPGISRSGSTISAGLAIGCSRFEAFKFSFLLFIPASLGAFVLEAGKINIGEIEWNTVITGFIISFLSGYIALKILSSTLRGGHFYKFSFYCLGMGVITILFSIK